MKNTETPETDAVNSGEWESLEIRYDLMHDLAEKLEIQRNEMIRIADRYIEDLDDSGDEIGAKDFLRWKNSILENADVDARIPAPQMFEFITD